MTAPDHVMKISCTIQVSPQDIDIQCFVRLTTFTTEPLTVEYLRLRYKLKALQVYNMYMYINHTVNMTTSPATFYPEHQYVKCEFHCLSLTFAALVENCKFT